MRRRGGCGAGWRVRVPGTRVGRLLPGQVAKRGTYEGAAPSSPDADFRGPHSSKRQLGQSKTCALAHARQTQYLCIALPIWFRGKHLLSVSFRPELKGPLMDAVELEAVQTTLIGFTKRAEKASEESLVATFVDSAPLFALLSTENNQVIYGRRGTGKTHALKVLAEHVERRGDHPVFWDLRMVGSNGSIYSDSSIPLAERASTLLGDALAGLLTEFYTIALRIIERHPNPDEVARQLDVLQSSLSTVKITGAVDEETRVGETARNESGMKATLGLSSRPAVNFDLSADFHRDREEETAKKRSGREIIHLNFGSIAGALSDMVAVLGGNRIWLLIDEWSEVPVDLQPYLADLFRRVVLPVNAITVKIAAIEHRSSFAILKERGEYIGLELGADVSADLNLDDFLVFDNSQDRAVDFIANLVFRHYETAPTEHPTIANPERLIGTLFTQRPVFEEFVRAVEGVPRDALNLIAKIVTKAYGQQIAMNHVRSGARDWYRSGQSIRD